MEEFFFFSTNIRYYYYYLAGGMRIASKLGDIFWQLGVGRACDGWRQANCKYYTM